MLALAMINGGLQPARDRAGREADGERSIEIIMDGLRSSDR
jgi:hypothetical protein